MIVTIDTEREVTRKFDKLKSESGSHSPSNASIVRMIPQIAIKVDACFLSNPYATELFLKYVKDELIVTDKIRDVLEFYPSPNRNIAGFLSTHLDIPLKNIFIGNGAIEIIQAVLHNFTRHKILINIPTFSSYYEFPMENVNKVYNQLDKQVDFQLDIERYITLVKSEKPDTIVLINPNNPDGGYISYHNLRYIVNELKEIENIIIDESFIHFAFENNNFKINSVAGLIKDFPNLIVIKSMSKDFGIAGVRAGYAVMGEKKVQYLLKHGYLWNSNGLAEYFFNLYTRDDFYKEYERGRIKYIKETQSFSDGLKNIKHIKLYPSSANFFLIELLDGITAEQVVIKLLLYFGVYVRNCTDKIGLDGEFIRIAARKKGQNQTILDAIKSLLC